MEYNVSMKQHQYSERNRKLNKKRLAALAVLLLGCSGRSSTAGETDWFFVATAQMVPLLAFERQYGNPEVDYAATYQVPEWFYEDEGIGADSVMEEAAATEVVEEAVVDPPVTTLAEGGTGITYSREQLEDSDFLLSHIFVVDGNTNMTSEELNLSNLLDVDLSMDGWNLDPSEQEREYKILIYHTHGSESFKDSREGKKEDTIIGVGSYLTKLLEEEYGISVYHDETYYDIIDGQLDRSKAYENAYSSVTQILQEHPSIEVVIDLHRDGIDEKTHLVTEINGKPTAKIMFLNGVSRSNTNGEIEYLYNPNKRMNLAFSFQMYLAGKEMYEDYVRKIYVRSYRYNLHLLPRTTLIEAGAQNNTVEEEMNAMEPLAAILYNVLSKKE